MLTAAQGIAIPRFFSLVVAGAASLDNAALSPLSAMLCPGLAAIRLPCLAHPPSALQAQRAVELPQLPAAAAPGPLPAAQPQASARPAASGLTGLSGDTVSEAVSAPTSTATPGTAGGTAAAAQAAAARVGCWELSVQWLSLTRAHCSTTSAELHFTSSSTEGHSSLGA